MILAIVLGIIMVISLCFIWAACFISSEYSRQEEWKEFENEEM